MHLHKRLDKRRRVKFKRVLTYLELFFEFFDLFSFSFFASELLEMTAKLIRLRRCDRVHARPRRDAIRARWLGD